MKINIETIPHDKQRYETVGDYWVEPDGAVQIRVSDMGNDDYAFLVALHELVEQKLTAKRGITNDQIDEFDKAFEAEIHEDDEEPGFADNCPYRKEHTYAMSVEMAMASEMDVNWNEYDKTVMSL